MTAENHQDFAEAKTAPQVAIVDDESGVRQTLVRGLERHGFLCRPFRSGVDFLDSLEFEMPDCVVLDLRMPDLDGMEVLNRIPAEAQGIPIILLTSHGEISLAVEAMQNGAVDFVEFRRQFFNLRRGGEGYALVSFDTESKAATSIRIGS